MNEFALIRQFFLRPAKRVMQGGGDDCALVLPRAGQVLAISTDMLLEGRHFFADVDPAALGFKALAVNLSDLAATCAEPLAFTLALALPEANERWLQPFSQGLFECAERFDCELIGGDTTRGPLAISITVFGEVPSGVAARRDAARAHDDIWISGELGGAALALAIETANRTADVPHRVRIASLVERLERPVPRVGLGLELRGLIHAMIDVSDGLLGDLRHITEASKWGATISESELPMPEQVRKLPLLQRRRAVLRGGDDYELCFTADRGQREAVIGAGARAGVAVTRIGEVTPLEGIRVLGIDNRPLDDATLAALSGFDHFG
jgi:thiamine-monophosphate kinase